MKTAFLFNPSPQWKRKTPLLFQRIHQRVDDDKQVFVVDRGEPDSTEKQLKKIIADKCDKIVVAGGDGSLNRVVNFLADARKLDRFTLGVLPFGTCNDFARKLGFRSGQMLQPIRALTQGRVRRVRVPRVNGRYFVNNAGFGRKNPAQKKKGALAALREMRPVSLEARWEGNRLNGLFFMMLCANAPYFSGGLSFSRQSDPTDGLLEFFLVKKSPKLALALRLLLGRAKLPLRYPILSGNILKIQTEKLILKAGESVTLVADGEPAGELEEGREAVFDIGGECDFIFRK